MGLRPIFGFFGSKWRSAPRYPAPRPTGPLVEPFAGGAGYSLRHHRRAVVLVEKDPVVAGAWRYLLTAPLGELARLPAVDRLDDLPAWVPQEGRWLVGFAFGAGDTRPRRAASSMVRRDGGKVHRIAEQAAAIRHWRLVEGDYTAAPDVEGTWFIDAPYQVAGSRARTPGSRGRVRYPCGGDGLDYDDLADFCLSRRGLVVVCENEGATWLPFEPLFAAASVRPGGAHHEVVFTFGR